MDIDYRQEQWVKASFATAKFEPFMPVTIQGLGTLDIQLIQKDEEYLEKHKQTEGPEKIHFEFSNQITLSYLWVLGAYEVIRTITQRIKENSGIVKEDIEKEFSQVKKAFNRLRVPLAKMEPAYSHRNTDSHIAYPALNIDHGVAWQVSQDTYITRRSLSNLMLQLLESTRASQINESNNT